MGEPEMLFANGVDALSGDYLLPPVSLDTLAAMIRGQERDPELEQFLRKLQQTRGEEVFAERGLELDLNDPAQAGWAIVFAQDEDPAVKAALEPLIAHRRQQVGERLKLLDYRQGEGLTDWLGRHGMGPGTLDPKKLPYYVLLVGSPEKIPFNFGFLLDGTYAVGRLAFDTPAEYSQYGAHLIEYETAEAVPSSKTAAFFAPRHPFDKATQLSHDQLVRPLLKGLDGVSPITEGSGYKQHALLEQEATIANLKALLHQGLEGKPVSLLFSASHGIGFPKDHPDQRDKQGGLVGQDWPGLKAIQPSHYLSAADLGAARVQGMVAFLFACYGAGTPAKDEFMHKPGQTPADIASRPFMARLPQTLLTQGALGVIGHVERAWGYSIVLPLAGAQLQPFQNALSGLMAGVPLGQALSEMNHKFTAESTILSQHLDDLHAGTEIPATTLTLSWIKRNDFKCYLLLGDPAARLRPEAMS
jgi:hypothetical protein